MKSLSKKWAVHIRSEQVECIIRIWNFRRKEPHYGKYGRMRLRYLKEHHKMLYNTLLLDGELVKHLNEVDDTANQRMELLTLQMQEQQGINEALKARDQMAWVGACNNIRNAAEEIVLNELICC